MHPGISTLQRTYCMLQWIVGRSLQSQLHGVQDEIVQVSNLQYHLNATQTDLASVNSWVTGLQTCISQWSSLSYSSPANFYWSCCQDTIVLVVFPSYNKNNDYRRLYMYYSTSPLDANIYNSRPTVIIRSQLYTSLYIQCLMHASVLWNKLP